MKKIEYLLSNLTRTEAEKKGKLKQWLKLQNEWEDYLKFKKELVQYGQVYSDKAIQWLYLNDAENAKLWLETSIEFAKIVDRNWDILTMNVNEDNIIYLSYLIDKYTSALFIDVLDNSIVDDNLDKTMLFTLKTVVMERLRAIALQAIMEEIEKIDKDRFILIDDYSAQFITVDDHYLIRLY
jgi:hypothetical protein